MQLPNPLPAKRLLQAILAAFAISGMTSCVSMQPPSRIAWVDQSKVREVTNQLVALPGAGEATRRDAEKIASVAVRESREQAARYEVAMPGWWHNMMVNSGIKERGLCWQWMEDIYPRLRALDTPSFNIVCGVRDAGTRREHHCVVAVPTGRPFDDGLVLDPWVKGGELVAFNVRGADRNWLYDPLWTDPLEQQFRAKQRARR
jgi:hypothetical protein